MTQFIVKVIVQSKELPTDRPTTHEFISGRESSLDDISADVSHFLDQLSTEEIDFDNNSTLDLRGIPQLEIPEFEPLLKEKPVKVAVVKPVDPEPITTAPIFSEDADTVFEPEVIEEEKLEVVEPEPVVTPEADIVSDDDNVFDDEGDTDYGFEEHRDESNNDTSELDDGVLIF